MPYYHELALRSKPTTAEIIFCPGVYDSKYVKEAKDINEIGTYDKNNLAAVSLGVGPLNQSLAFNTSIEWSGMGSLGDSLLQGFVDTLKRNKQNILTLLSGLSGFSRFVGWAGGEETAKDIINAKDKLWSGKQVDFITNQGFTKAYSGSTNQIEIPTIEIILYAKSESDNILTKLQNIMSYINPRTGDFVEITGEKGKESQDERAKTLNQFLLVEYAPGNYMAGNNNFNLNDLQNTFLVRLGYKYIPYCLPVGINIQLSKSGFQGKEGTWIPHYIRIAIQMQTAYRVLTKDMIEIIKNSSAHSLRD